jgi:hypothetical protein
MWIPSNIRKYNDGVQSEIPDEFAKGLKPRDIMFWKQGPDGTITVKFGKINKLIEQEPAMTELST